MADLPNPRVGIAVLLFNTKGEVLLGERKGSHGSGKPIPRLTPLSETPAFPPRSESFAPRPKKPRFPRLTSTPHTGTHAFPGGHLEYGENFAECGRRELLEETGLTAATTPGAERFLTAVNTVFTAERKHYITVFVALRVRDAADQPQVSPVFSVPAPFPSTPMTAFGLGSSLAGFAAGGGGRQWLGSGRCSAHAGSVVGRRGLGWHVRVPLSIEKADRGGCVAARAGEVRGLGVGAVAGAAGRGPLAAPERQCGRQEAPLRADCEPGGG
jgi:ADP-ribose pyrophosphatase YjhB (NUDIX family)